MPVKINGSEDGSTSLTSLVVHFSCSRRATLTRSRSMELTPRPVLMSVGHSEHSVTVMAEIRNDFSNIGSALTYTALTMMVTSGSHASGDTGLKIWINRFSAELIVVLSPHRMPSGTAISVASKNPVNTVLRLVPI